MQRDLDCLCDPLLMFSLAALQSTWVVHECEHARKLSIPIISLVDADLQPARQVVDGYIAQGWNWLFDEQCLHYSTQGREKSYELVAEAILRAVASCGSRAKVKAAPKQEPAGKKDRKANVHSVESSVDQLKAALLEEFGSAKEAFAVLSNGNQVVGKKEWKHAVSRLLPLLSVQESKSVRKQLPKKVNIDAFVRFFNDDGDGSEEAAADEETQTQDKASLAKLPDEVPEVRTLLE